MMFEGMGRMQEGERTACGVCVYGARLLGFVAHAGGRHMVKRSWDLILEFVCRWVCLLVQKIRRGRREEGED